MKTYKAKSLSVELKHLLRQEKNRERIDRKMRSVSSTPYFPNKKDVKGLRYLFERNLIKF